MLDVDDTPAEGDEKIITALRRAGLKTIGQVMARGRDELAARFGKAFVAETGPEMSFNESHGRIASVHSRFQV